MSLPRVLILAGGLGTRLSAAVPNLPKPMAPISGRPFLEYPIEYLRKQGFRKFTLLTGHLSNIIEGHFGDGRKFGVEIEYSREDAPLGTGGAIRKAIFASEEERFLVLNGDTFFAVDIRYFLNHARGPVSLALKYTTDLSRYGTVKIDSAFKVTGFFEKSHAAPEGYINAGVCLITRDALASMPEGRFSFETEFLEPLSGKAEISAIPCGGPFVDIGTSESYHWAQERLPGWLELNFKPCLFVDRDGILVRHVHHLHKIEEVEIISETSDILRFAKSRGWWIVVVTNQSGVGRGIFTQAQCDRLNAHIDKELVKLGAKPDVWECSYHHPTEGRGEFKRESLRRKPNPGMLLAACDLLPIDVSKSLMIGDNSTDQILLPGLRTILVQGSFELRDIRAGNLRTEDFADLRRVVCEKIAES